MVVGSDRYRVREAVRDPRSIGLLGRCGIPFVSLLSDSGDSIEEIARLVGHKGGSAVTEKVYRKQPRPVIQTGATAMDGLFAATIKRRVEGCLVRQFVRQA